MTYAKSSQQTDSHLKFFNWLEILITSARENIALRPYSFEKWNKQLKST